MANDGLDEETPLLSQDSNNAERGNGSSPDSTEDAWDDPSNPSNPRNWSSWFKWATVILVSFIEFLTTMPNFMYAPNVSLLSGRMMNGNFLRRLLTLLPIALVDHGSAGGSWYR